MEKTMKTGKSLVDLATELQRQQDAKKDFVADTRQLVATANGDVTVAVGNLAKVGVNDHAHRQLGQWAGIHGDYYDKMKVEAPQLLATNLNHWFQHKPAKKMVRTLDTKMRAFVSDSYRPLDNFDLANSFLPVANDLKAQPRSMDVTDTRLYMRVVLPYMEAEVKVGEPVRWGLSVSNSEVGSGALRLEEFIEVLRCTNGMTLDTVLRKAHLGKAQHGLEDAQEYLTRDSQRLQDAAFWGAFRDMVKGLLTRERFENALQRMRNATEQKISGTVVEVVEVTAKHLKLNQSEQKNILQHLIEGGDLTRWGLCNAITRTAEDANTFDRAYELEKAGAQVLSLPSSDWKRLSETSA
jgi:hypothetical protein